MNDHRIGFVFGSDVGGFSDWMQTAHIRTVGVQIAAFRTVQVHDAGHYHDEKDNRGKNQTCDALLQFFRPKRGSATGLKDIHSGALSRNPIRVIVSSA